MMTKRNALHLATKLCSTILPGTNKVQFCAYTCFIPRAIWFNPRIICESLKYEFVKTVYQHLSL